MARDMKKKAESDRLTHNRIYSQRGIKIRKDSGIPDALELMSEKTGMPVNSYIITCIREALIRDGYLKEEQSAIFSFNMSICRQCSARIAGIVIPMNS